MSELLGPIESIKLFRESTFAAPVIDAVAKAEDAVRNADALTITDDRTLNLANESFQLATKLAKLFEEERKKRTDPLNAQAKAIKASFDLIIDPTLSVKAIMDKKIMDYRKAERERIEQEQIAAERERQRLADEQRKSELNDAEARGIQAPPPLELPDVLPPPASIPQASRTTVGTVFTKKEWKATVTDLKALCAAIGRGEAPSGFVEPVASALNAQAKLVKGPSPYPGVAFNEYEKLTSR